MQFFYSKNIDDNYIILEGEEMIHCIKSLRNKVGDTICVVDGNGGVYDCKIIEIDLEFCKLSIINKKIINNKKKIHLFIAPTKNHKRIEWMLEKIVEIGIYRVTFLICENSIRKTVNLKRLHKIALSAMKQTQNYFLPIIDSCLPFYEAFKVIDSNEKYIAHLCYNNIPLLNKSLKNNKKKCIFIGPEGDFTNSEVSYALKNNFIEVSLGKTRLRTETSGIVSATILNLHNE
jgi:16S rRNA (uracil1498-N3)-methyltransferase